MAGAYSFLAKIFNEPLLSDVNAWWSQMLSIVGTQIVVALLVYGIIHLAGKNAGHAAGEMANHAAERVTKGKR